MIATRPMLWVFVLGALGCNKADTGPDTGGVSPSADTTPRMDGKLRVKDQWVDVPPLILHDGKMDLFVRCKVMQEEATKAGREVPPLCYDPTPRPPEEIDVIRVERWLSLPVAMRYLQGEAEGTHFLVERSGSTYQMLDLVYPVRRAGAFLRGEIRVVATDEKKGATITQTLRALYPKARVEEVDMTKVTTRQGPGPVPFAPGGPRPGRGQDHGHDHHGHDHGHDHHGHDHGHDHAHPEHPKPNEGTP